ncbi:hypothetical protein B7P43_G12569 [Cryptotermes secundus]|uniref:Uncharacterized protein n=1 Tax=Cryptotermes secundus TaxID=105785 RepID=A0A2J7QXB4_9NEOP|nr:hypothetical protein B7P43_G12569 [Cryptotermes secundus]
MSAELDNKICQQAQDTSCIADELTAKIIQNKEQVTEQISELSEEIKAVKSDFAKNEEIFQKRQGERLEQVLQVIEKEKSLNKRNFDELKSAISNSKGKLPVSPRAATSVEKSQPSESSFVPANLAVNANDDCTDSNNENGGFACSDNHESCNVRTNGGVSDQNVPISVRLHSVSRYLSQTDFSLPIFDDSSEVNAMFRLNQLDELMQLKGIPKQFQLGIAYKSIVDPGGKQWLAAISHTLTNYERFKIKSSNAKLATKKRMLATKKLKAS